MTGLGRRLQPLGSRGLCSDWVERMKVGKDFKKTNSQQTCKVDVNKASELWEAFNKVG
jgi:hypothetical protein